MTVWRKGHNMDAFWQTWVTLPQMEAGLVSNHNMMRLRIAGAEVFQVELIAIQVDRRQMHKLSTSLHDLYSHSAPLWH